MAGKGTAVSSGTQLRDHVAARAFSLMAVELEDLRPWLRLYFGL